MLSLIPDLQIPTVCDLTPELLSSRGLNVLFLDFDNTLLPYTCDQPTPELLSWIDSMKRAGITLCVLSNTKRGRAQDFCMKQDVPCVSHAKKPGQKAIRAALRRYGNENGGAALVGDQIYTDVLCANLAGIDSVLVKPLHLHNVWLKLRYVLETPWIAIGKRRMRRAKRE